MNEIDLVPVDYRQRIRVRSWLRTFGVVMGATLLLLGGARAFLAWSEQSRRGQIEELRAAEQQAIAQEAHLAQLDQEHQLARRRLSILSGLRGGISSDVVFLAVDRALDEGIWFRDWTFRRAGEFVDGESKAVKTGYFLVVPLEPPEEGGSRAWRLETHMEITGQARDHSTLAGFVSRLLDQPRIREVRVVNTRQRRYAATEVVEFELAVLVGTSA